jgi:5-methylcytosine-specific restriction endonuclease McrBC GTP-binding regulatory subunit McrB
MAFEYYKGPLRRLADAAAKNYRQPGEILPYVLIIDEINRGNVSKIFGELITLIEEDKRGINGHKEGLSVKLLYENDAAKRFFLPPNLYIIGTMNTADRSVQRLDSALRRRFEFENIAPNPELLKDNKTLKEFLEKLNVKIYEKLHDTGSQIGHAWFMEKGKVLSSRDNILRALNNKVVPLLIEWFWDQPESLKDILGNESYDLVFKNGVNTILTEENLDKFLKLG